MRVWGLGLRDRSRFRSLGLWVGSGFRALGFRVKGVGFKALGRGSYEEDKVQALGFRFGGLSA